MTGKQLNFLDSRDRLTFDEHDDVRAIAGGPALASEQGGGEQPFRARGAQAGDDVGRTAAAAQREGDVRRPAQRFDLPGEDTVEMLVVGDAAQDRAVGAEREGGKAIPLQLETIDEFGRKVLGLRRAAAVSEQQDFAAAAQALGAFPSQPVESVPLRFDELRQRPPQAVRLLVERRGRVGRQRADRAGIV